MVTGVNGFLHLAEKEIRSGFTRFQIARFAEAARRIFVRAHAVLRRTESGQYARRLRMQAHSFSQNLDRGLRRFVQQKLRAPIEIILLAGIHARSAFVFADCGERIV